MKLKLVVFVVVIWIFGVVVGFFGGRLYPSGTVARGRCVNDLGENRDAPGKNNCDGKELGASCSGSFGAGTCRSTVY